MQRNSTGTTTWWGCWPIVHGEWLGKRGWGTSPEYEGQGGGEYNRLYEPACTAGCVHFIAVGYGVVEVARVSRVGVSKWVGKAVVECLLVACCSWEGSGGICMAGFGFHDVTWYRTCTDVTSYLSESMFVVRSRWLFS